MSLADKYSQAIRQPTKTTGPALEGPEGFVRSLAWSIPGLIGVNPPDDVAQWEAENPGAAVVAGILGTAGPYLGWWKAARAIPGLKNHIERADKIAKSEAPFLGGAQREILAFAPFEGARVAGAFFGGEDVAEHFGTTFQGTDRVLMSAGMDLGIVGLAGGGLQKLGSWGSREKPSPLSGVDLRDTPQRALQTLRAKPDADPGTINNLERQVRLDAPERGKRPVQMLEDSGTAQGISRLFKAGSSTGLDKKKFAQGVDGSLFDTTDEWRAAAKAAGIEKHWDHVQWPRYVRPKTDKAKSNVESAIKRGLKGVDSERGWYMGRDTGDGLFVMARKVNERDWTVFKTDAPGLFVPNTKVFADSMARRAAAFGQRDIGIKELEVPGTDVWNTVARVAKMPLIETRGMDDRAGAVKKIAQQLGIDDLGGDSELLYRANRFIKDTLAPTMLQFSGNPVAARVIAVAQASRAAADAAAERLFHGGRVLRDDVTNLFQAIYKGADVQPTGNIRSMIRELGESPEELKNFRMAWLASADPEDAAKLFGLGSKGMQLYRELVKIDDERFAALNAIKRELGQDEFVPLPWHLGISRTWTGDHRIPIYNVQGRTEGYASGRTLKEAQEDAAQILEMARREGQELTVGKPMLAGSLDLDAELLKRLMEPGARNVARLRSKAYAPDRLTKERKGARFFKGDMSELSADDIEKLVFKQLRDYKTYEAKLATQHAVAKDLLDLAQEDRQLAESVLKRVGLIFEEQGPIAKGINEGFDKVFSPVLGRNSASKIVASSNKLLFRLTLGFANTAYNMANMLTFMQTAFPHLAFLTTAHPARISQYYTMWPMEGEKALRHVGALDIFKIMGQSFKEMGKPSPQLLKHFERGAAEGVWDPRFVEEYVGETSRKVLNFRGVMNGEQPFSEFLGAAADFLPSISEKFARGHSFAMGHVFFKNVMGITDDELLYQLSKQFTEKTQFMYATGDRAQIITGPLGSSFGIFKNWIMHYLGWMGAYAGEGVARGNWKPLMFMMGGTASVGGIGALPFYMTGDALSRWLSDETIMQHTYNAFGGTSREGPVAGAPLPIGHVSDAVMYGLPAFLGFSIQNQVSIPFMDPGADAARLMSFAWWDRMKAAGRTMGAAIDHWDATGQSPTRDPHTLQLLMRTIAPKNVYRTTQVIQDQTIRSLNTGYPITTLTPGERIAYSFGLNPRWIESRFRVADELWRDQDKRLTAVKRYGEAYAEAMQSRDKREMQQILLRALYEGVDISSVLKSADARNANFQTELIDRQFSPENILGYRKLGLVD